MSPGFSLPRRNSISFSGNGLPTLTSGLRRDCLAIWQATHIGAGHEDTLGVFVRRIGSVIPSGADLGRAANLWIQLKFACPSRQCHFNNSFCDAVIFWLVSSATVINAASPKALNVALSSKVNPTGVLVRSGSINGRLLPGLYGNSNTEPSTRVNTERY
jgi:hypothetical protein